MLAWSLPANAQAPLLSRWYRTGSLVPRSASPSQGHRWYELMKESLTGGFFRPSQESGPRHPPLLFRTSPRVYVSRPRVSSFTFTPLFKGSTLLGTGDPKLDHFDHFRLNVTPACHPGLSQALHSLQPPTPSTIPRPPPTIKPSCFSHPSPLARTTGRGPLGSLDFSLPGSREAPKSPLSESPLLEAPLSPAVSGPT